MGIGHDAPLTEDGYQAVARLRSNAEMEVFVRRTITAMGLRLADEKPLGGFVLWYSGDKAVQNNARLRQELLEHPWIIHSDVTGDNVPLTEEGYQRLAALGNTTQMIRLVHRVLAETHSTCSDEGRIAGLAAYYSGEKAVQSLQRLREELMQLDWITHPPVDHPAVAWWMPDVNCDGIPAKDRAKWLVENQGLSEHAARLKVRSEFPTVAWWVPDAMCEGIRAEDRAKWLVDNQGLSVHAARAKVQSEFPSVFGGGARGGSARFGERLSRVAIPGGSKSKLRIEVRPEDPAGVSLVAVHYSINGSPELNFDIRHFDHHVHAWVHETPSGDGFPDVTPGSVIRYWVYMIRNGVGEQEPHDATAPSRGRLEVRL